MQCISTAKYFPHTLLYSNSKNYLITVSYSSWLSSVGLPANTSPLPEWARLQLIDDLGVDNYFSLDEKCYNKMTPFMTSTATNGFNNGM